MNRVSLTKCSSYQLDQLDSALTKVLSPLGGLENFVQPGQKVFLKLNLVMKKDPLAGATSHPAFVELLARKIKSLGAIPIIGDSPGGPYTPAALRSVYKGCGIEEAALKADAILNYDTSQITLPHPEGKILKNITLTKALMDADVIISLSKLKTHGMTLFTGAVKNLFGAIPGLSKAEYHLNMPNIEDFSNMLVDVCTLVKPHLSIMDAIIGMEGNGPTAGTPRKIGAILASQNPFALDVVATSLVGISPLAVGTIQRAQERKLCSGRLKNIEIIGDSLEDLLIKDFQLPTSSRNINFFQRWKLPTALNRFLTRALTPKPTFNYQKCVGCQDCVKHCPPQVIKMLDKKPIPDLEGCIRCFCCQELCPHQAVEIKRPWLNRLILGKK